MIPDYYAWIGLGVTVFLHLFVVLRSATGLDLKKLAKVANWINIDKLKATFRKIDKLDDSHHGPKATDENMSYRWWNNKNIETAIVNIQKSTEQTAKAIDLIAEQNRLMIELYSELKTRVGRLEDSGPFPLKGRKGG